MMLLQSRHRSGPVAIVKKHRHPFFDTPFLGCGLAPFSPFLARTISTEQYRFLQAEASTYLSSAKGVLRAALQADAVTFKRNVKPLINDHPAYQGGVGHTFMGSFYLVAPWPIHNLAKAKVRVANQEF